MLEIGKIYLVSSSRKGKFFGMIKSFDETWATCKITAGKAGAMMEHSEKNTGEEVTVRRSFCVFTEQPDSALTGSQLPDKEGTQ